MSSTHVIPRNREVYIERTIEVIECAACSIDFGIGADFMARRRKDNATFYCPNGHSNHYPKPQVTDAEKLRRAEARETALKDQLDAANREAESTRVALIRDRHRFANGVCPCCNRSFGNVRRHMTTQHPDYDVTQVVQPNAKARCSCGREFATPHGLAIHQARMRPDDWAASSTPKWRAHLTVAGRR